MLPKFLKPKHEYDLIRLGGNYDGGYVVEKNSIEKSEGLITLGLGYEWTFEKDYFRQFKKPIHCYDHTVNYSSIKKLSRKALASNFFRFFKPKYFAQKNFFSNIKKEIFLYKDYKNLFKDEVKHFTSRVGPGNGPGNQGVSLKNIFEKITHLPCFLKVDIETSEYRILNDIIQLQDKLTGLAIEFHDIDLHMDKIENFIKSLNMTLVHIHPMNQALVVNNIPIQVEISFSKDPIKINENCKIPHHLDMPGNPAFQDINLKFQK